MALGQGPEVGDDFVHAIANGQVAPYDVWIRVGEDGWPSGQETGGVEVEEDRAAAQERLEIGPELRRVVTA
jgi:hypothetical protein